MPAGYSVVYDSLGKASQGWQNQAQATAGIKSRLTEIAGEVQAGPQVQAALTRFVATWEHDLASLQTTAEGMATNLTASVSSYSGTDDGVASLLRAKP